MSTRVAILAVGDELLAGDRSDLNGTWLARALTARGARVARLQCVGDELGPMAAAVVEAARAADLVVVGGGLGPTLDDLTRAGLARAAGTELVHDEDAWEAVVACLARRGRRAGEPERRQALVPRGGRWLPNEVGVAPGLEVAVEGTRVLAFPGVPREWRAFCEALVLAPLGPQGEVAEDVLWVAGVPEGDVAARLAGAPALAGVQQASYPHDGEVELRLRARGSGAAERVQAAAAEARRRLGADLFEPPPGGRLEHAVVAALARRGWTLATAESVTGGLVARMLTRVPGASGVYPVGWVTYATAQKTACLGVPPDLVARHGVVSAEVACAMAEGARGRAATHAALATTGTAGPDPLVEVGRPPVPPGRVHVALAVAGGPTQALELALPHPREMVQRLAAVRALDLLRRALA